MSAGSTPNFSRTPAASRTLPLRRSTCTTRSPCTHCARSLSGVQMQTFSHALVGGGDARGGGERRRRPRGRSWATPRRPSRPAPPRAGGTARGARARCRRRSCSRATARCGTTRSRGRSRRRCASRPPRSSRARSAARRRTAPSGGSCAFVEAAQAVEVAEQLVGAVDEVDDHAAWYPASRRPFLARAPCCEADARASRRAA